MIRWKTQSIVARVAEAVFVAAGVLAMTTSIQAERQYVKNEAGQ